MKYKVGDPVIVGSETGKIVKAPYTSNTGTKVVRVRWKSGGTTEEWIGNIGYDYRALYKQEKKLREAADDFISNTMDKIQELHWEVDRKKINAALATLSHASITDDMMGKFAEWKDINGWVYMKSEKVFLNSEGPLTPKSTAELIQLFKETL